MKRAVHQAGERHGWDSTSSRHELGEQVAAPADFLGQRERQRGKHEVADDALAETDRPARGIQAGVVVRGKARRPDDSERRADDDGRHQDGQWPTAEARVV